VTGSLIGKSRILLVSCVLIALGLSSSTFAVRADQGGATNAISSARRQLISCYDAAGKAEAAGANITKLAATLDEAGLLLSQAEFAFSNGDFVSAQNYAVQSQSSLSAFVSNANALQSAAEAERNQDFMTKVIGSAGGTVAVLVGGFVLWHFLKRKYPSDGGQEFGSGAV
jgi:hypothetical protein